jgi:hypothetical protein
MTYENFYMSGDEDIDDEHFGPDELPYRPVETIDPNELAQALTGLSLLGGDLYLRMQAMNIAMVDNMLMPMEQTVLELLIQTERTPVEEALGLSALSQMWLFAAYELLRTWRQRARKALEWHKAGVLNSKIAEYETTANKRANPRLILARELRSLESDPSVAERLRDDLARVHMPFTRLDHLRISLAKHEIKSKRDSFASAPGYGRVNMFCGALDYQLEIGTNVLELINRRDIADELRAIPTGDPPDAEARMAFDLYMKGNFDNPFKQSS